jgi:IclR family pca regulon transcriptional regulator
MPEEFVQSLARGLQVITAFDADRPRMSLSEVAVAAGLSRAAARRFLHTLVELGYVRTDGRQFELTPHVLRLGTAYLSGFGLPQLAQPHLERLSAAIGESTSAAVLDGTEISYVARVSIRRIMTVGITVGTRFPAFATSMGRVLLAHLGPEELDAYFLAADLTPPTPHTVHTEAELRRVLAEVARQGWAEVDQELEAGLYSLAAPIRDANQQVVAAINVSTTSPERPAELRGQVLAAAAAISTDLERVSMVQLTR